MDGQYSVEFGGYCQSYWVKDIQKSVKRSTYRWEDIEEALLLEYRSIEKSVQEYASKYDIITVSNGGQYKLFKHDVKTSPDKSAKQSGVRATLFVEAGTKVVILFIGHHDHYNKMYRGNEKDCVKNMVRHFYPDLAKLLGL